MNVIHTSDENVSDKKNVVNTFIIGAQQNRIGAMNQYLLSFLKIANTRRIQNAVNVFMMLIRSGDQPNIFVKRLINIGYVIKCPPYVDVDKGFSKLPMDMASIKNEEGYIPYGNCLAQKLNE